MNHQKFVTFFVCLQKAFLIQLLCRVDTGVSICPYILPVRRMETFGNSWTIFQAQQEKALFLFFAPLLSRHTQHVSVCQCAAALPSSNTVSCSYHNHIPKLLENTISVSLSNGPEKRDSHAFLTQEVFCSITSDSYKRTDSWILSLHFNLKLPFCQR